MRPFPLLLALGAGCDDTDRAAERDRMVREQIEARGVRAPRVLAAMRAVPRERFVPGHLSAWAYDDSPLPIGHDQTISQPYVVAFMSEALQVEPGMRVLEVGTGSGYQAAVLAEMGAEVWSIEIVPALAELARAQLAAAGFDGRVQLRTGDGYAGWPEAAPFDRIIVTAAPGQVPAPLRAQLRVGGRMVIPVGDQSDQNLLLIERTGETSWAEEAVLPVRFVPMTGEAERAG